MSKPTVIHKQDPSGRYWVGYAKCVSGSWGSQKTTEKWARVTCKNCLKMRPKPKK